MTVTYTAEVATCHKFGCFLKLLFRWRGSVYKLVWMDLLVFLAAYYFIQAIYRFSLNSEQQKTFERFVTYCSSYGSLIPLSFVLGFYVSIVMQRWWDQYMAIPWPDNLAVFVSAHIHGQDERGRVMRRTIMRYTCLCKTMVLTMISPRVKKRFPTLEHLVEAGLMLENEKRVFEQMTKACPLHPLHWMPIVWAASIVTRARKEGRIRDDIAVKTIIDELNKFRGNCGVLMYFDSISIPLVYTQVVTLAVYSYFLCNVMGRQWTRHVDGLGYENVVDMYFPIFTTLQFFFYMGWLKVAETLINPFGEDDDDFEVNWMIDRNLQMCYLIVDDMHHEHPQLVKDQYWDEVFPNELPYANDDVKREVPPQHSTARVNVSRYTSLVKVDVEKDTHKPNGHVDNGSVSKYKSVQSHSSKDQHSNKLKMTHSKASKPSNITIISEVIRNLYYPGEEDRDYSKRSSSYESIITYKEDMGEGGEEDQDDEDKMEEGVEKDSGNEADTDPFEVLRIQREKERQDRQRQKLSAHLGNMTAINFDKHGNVTNLQPAAFSTPFSTHGTSSLNLDDTVPYDALRYNYPAVPSDIAETMPPMQRHPPFLSSLEELLGEEEETANGGSQAELSVTAKDEGGNENNRE